MKKKFKILIVIGLLVCAYILFLIPRLNKLDKRSEREARILYLKQWSNQVEIYRDKEGRLPNSLFEAAWFDFLRPPRVKVKTGNLSFPRISELKDPNIFFNEIEYALIVYHDGWFIIELKPGLFGEYRLMIDQDRKLYELREIKQE